MSAIDISVTLTDETLDRLADLVAARLQPTAAPVEQFPPWLDRREAARYTSLSPTTIERLRKTGQIPFRLVNSRYIYPRAGLDQFIRSQPGNGVLS